MTASGDIDTIVATALGELRVRGSSARLTAELSAYHCLDGRGFGGWTAALAGLAASCLAADKHLRSLQTIFSRGAVPGELTFEVTTLVEGRTASAYRVTAYQTDQPVLAALAWFTAPSLLAPTGLPSPDFATQPTPESCPRVDWIAKIGEFLGGFEIRAVDYALSQAEFEGPFRDGGDGVALWVGAAAGWGGSAETGASAVVSGLAERLTDLMMFDAFLMDAALRGRPGDGMLTLDLTTEWHATPGPATGMTLLQATGHTHGLVASTHGTLTSLSGHIRATATSQCRVYPGAGR
ncbi:acyl-CoA thioesterase [Uniformispora flossi]|uniref:acyl-CoA thioesterase n=1 Tax=Uniformispora flossi TaxID=3390723 RepID=UPI003C2B4875